MTTCDVKHARGVTTATASPRPVTTATASPRGVTTATASPSLCRSCDRADAPHFCVDCTVHLCQPCHDDHLRTEVFSRHSVVDINSEECDVVKRIVSGCPVHCNAPLLYYCENGACLAKKDCSNVDICTEKNSRNLIHYPGLPGDDEELQNEEDTSVQYKMVAYGFADCDLNSPRYMCSICVMTHPKHHQLLVTSVCEKTKKDLMRQLNDFNKLVMELKTKIQCLKQDEQCVRDKQGSVSQSIRSHIKDACSINEEIETGIVLLLNKIQIEHGKMESELKLKQQLLRETLAEIVHAIELFSAARGDGLLSDSMSIRSVIHLLRMLSVNNITLAKARGFLGSIPVCSHTDKHITTDIDHESLDLNYLPCSLDTGSKIENIFSSKENVNLKHPNFKLSHTYNVSDNNPIIPPSEKISTKTRSLVKTKSVSFSEDLSFESDDLQGEIPSNDFTRCNNIGNEKNNNTHSKSNNTDLPPQPLSNCSNQHKPCMTRSKSLCNPVLSQSTHPAKLSRSKSEGYCDPDGPPPKPLKLNDSGVSAAKLTFGGCMMYNVFGQMSKSNKTVKKRVRRSGMVNGYPRAVNDR